MSAAILELAQLRANNGLSGTFQIVALIGALALLFLVFELVRRRRLVERYALLWMVLTAALVVLVIWTDLLAEVAELVGIKTPSNLLFLASLGVGFVLLLHFSVAISRLSEETKMLAQDNARLDAELRAARGQLPPSSNGSAEGAPNGDGAGSAPERGADETPVEPQGGAEQR